MVLGELDLDLVIGRGRQNWQNQIMTFVQLLNDETGITSPKRPPFLQNYCWTWPASHLVGRFDLSTKAFGFSFDISKTC